MITQNKLMFNAQLFNMIFNVSLILINIALVIKTCMIAPSMLYSNKIVFTVREVSSAY